MTVYIPETVLTAVQKIGLAGILCFFLFHFTGRRIPRRWRKRIFLAVCILLLMQNIYPALIHIALFSALLAVGFAVLIKKIMK